MQIPQDKIIRFLDKLIEYLEKREDHDKPGTVRTRASGPINPPEVTRFERDLLEIADPLNPLRGFESLLGSGSPAEDRGGPRRLRYMPEEGLEPPTRGL
jgi:hypothetical protein